MKVILLKDVKNVGKKGDTVSVSDGYASNFLIPRGLAVTSTESSQKELAKQEAQEEARQKELYAEAKALAERLSHINVEFLCKAGGDGRMVGSVSTKEIESELFKQWGIKIDKRKFVDKYPANAFGYTRLQIELYKGSQGSVIGTVNVHIGEKR